MTNQYDGLGSARQTTSMAGGVVSSLTTEGFGQAIASSGGSNTYGFAATSGYRDDGDAGLLHVGARYYDAEMSRFLGVRFGLKSAIPKSSLRWHIEA